jgi:hypothetical protein
MNQLLSSQFAIFVKRFRFRGGVMRRFRIRNRSPHATTGEIIVDALEGEKRVRLRLVFDGVDEYRFQRRPGPGLYRLREVRIGAFNGMIYLDLDAYVDDPLPAVHDFRASDAFIAGRTLHWEIVTLPHSPGN